MQKIKNTLIHYRLAILSGIFIGTSYIPFPPWAILFAFLPLWIFSLEKAQTAKEAFWAGWWTQFILTIIGFHWIAGTAHEFAFIPWPLSILILFLFASVIHIYFAFANLTAWWLTRKFLLDTWAKYFLFACLFALFEYFWPSIFEWNLGYTLLWAKMPAFHFAEWIGFLGLSFLILIANAWLCILWTEWKKGVRNYLHQFIFISAMIGLNLFGLWLKNRINEPQKQIQVGIIQANIGNLEKIYAERGKGYQSAIAEKFLSMSLQLVNEYPEIDLLVWPETAFPDFLDDYKLDREHPKKLIAGLQRINKFLLTGAYSIEKGANPSVDRSTYNAVFTIGPQGQNLTPPYRKTHLLAFGEYFPLSDRFPILLKWFPFISNFGRGNGPTSLNFPFKDSYLKIGPQICYEALYPHFSRGLAKAGADILINVTNDSWFGKYFEPYQHLYMTLARGVETRRPLIRSTNTGISTAITAHGEVLELSPVQSEWQGVLTIPYQENAPLTIYTRFGGWLPAFLLLFTIATLLLGATNAKTRRP